MASSIYNWVATVDLARCYESTRVSANLNTKTFASPRIIDRVYCDMENNLNRAQKVVRPPTTSPSHLNIQAFDTMAYPFTGGDMYPDYYDESLGPASNHSYSEAVNVSLVEKLLAPHCQAPWHGADNNRRPMMNISRNRMRWTRSLEHAHCTNTVWRWDSSQPTNQAARRRP